MKAWYEIDNVDLADSPALVVFPERVQYNIDQAISMVGKVERLRPHIKTHKSPDVVDLMIRSGITKFKCATIAEAEILGQAGSKDVLLAYQPFGPKLDRFIQLIQTYPSTQYACLVDHKMALVQMASKAVQHDLTLNLFLDINVGMYRTGISPGIEAEQLYTRALSYPQFRVIGLHAYDGHIRDQDMKIRTEQCDRAFQQVVHLNENLKLIGGKELLLVCGGSLTFPIHASRTKVECSPGTFVYWDKGFRDLYDEEKFLPAAVLITRVISNPSKDKICIDLGHKSVASENDLDKRIEFLNVQNLKPLGQSEEHLVLQHDPGQTFETGQILYGLPFHICPTVALYERVLTVRDHKISGEWSNIARNRKITI